MGVKSSKEMGGLISSGDLARVPDKTILTDSISTGRTGREWHLPFEAVLDRKAASARSSAVQIAAYRGEDSIARLTCEFLRKHAPDTYKTLYEQLQSHLPTHPEFPETRRAARDGVPPSERRNNSDKPSGVDNKKFSKQARFEITVPELGPDHWAYKRHANIGNYCTEKSGARHDLIALEGAQDIESIKHYLTCYQALAQEVHGQTLWKATRHAAVRDPYLTCMEICVGELQIPSHFLSLVHYGMGLHMMYELSMPWEESAFPKRVPRKLISALRESFESLAQLYREDFCS
jgi:hypothetical protein